MHYNKELQRIKQKEQELINDAKVMGYSRINGQFIKDKIIPVIEIYVYGETTHESYGAFMIFKKTIPLTKEQLTEIKGIQQTKEDIINDFIYDDGILTKLKGLDNFYDILEWHGQLDPENIERIVDDLEDEYPMLQDGCNLYLEFFFELGEGLRGYISVYDMPSDELAKQDNIDLTLNKYLTSN